MRQVIVRTKEQYWKDYILEGLSKKLSKEMIKQQLLDAFRKEIFGLITMRAKVDNFADIQETPENKKMIENVSKQAQNKWISLCIMCAHFEETKGLIMPSDIEKISEEENA